MVRPTRIYRPRELLSVESVVGDVSGTDVDWGTSPIGIPASSGRDQWKQPVRVASTASVTVSTALNNGDTIDGVTLATGDRVLLKDQSTGSQNGIYIVGATPIRAADMDDDDEVLGALVYVIAGTTNTATAWKVTNTSAVTVGSTSIVWAAFGTGGSASFATPAIVLGTAAAAGAASTVIRSDATIVAFDATSPADVASSAATGSAAFAPHRDHAHRGVKSLSKSGSAALYGDVTLTGGTNVTLTQSGNDISIASTGGGGGGTDFVSGASGTGQIIIPGLAGSPDIRVAGTNDDEFDTTDTSDPMTGWTTLGTPTSHDINSSAKSQYRVLLNATASTADVGIYKACPSIPFTVTAKVTDAYIRASFNKAGLFVAESPPGKLAILNIFWNTSVQVATDIHTNRTTYASTVASTTFSADMPAYLRIVVTSSTNIAYYYSANGYVWRLLASGNNPGFTVGTVGLMVGSENASSPGEAYFDWVRFS